MPEPDLRTGWVEKFLGGTARAEAQYVQQFILDIHKVQVDDQTSARTVRPSRAFHAKGHLGVTNAQFMVAPDLPENLRFGVLQPGRSFPATVRLSNGHGFPQADTKRDLRGIAVRVFADDAGFDLLSTNAASSHARDAKQFMDFARATAGPKLLLLPRLIQTVGLLEMVRILLKVLKQTGRKVFSLATEQYWSRAPYALGPYALKFTFVPKARAEGAPGTDENYLRTEIVERLKAAEVTYDLRAQFWVDEETTPIEDGSVEWMETAAPPLTLGRLTIPRQDVTEPEAEKIRARVDLIEFNPWHNTEPLRPLGSLNRARRLVYASSAEFRENVSGPAEPTA